jgi:hypothetical protein
MGSSDRSESLTDDSITAPSTPPSGGSSASPQAVIDFDFPSLMVVGADHHVRRKARLPARSRRRTKRGGGGQDEKVVIHQNDNKERIDGLQFIIHEPQLDTAVPKIAQNECIIGAFGFKHKHCHSVAAALLYNCITMSSSI